LAKVEFQKTLVKYLKDFNPNLTVRQVTYAIVTDFDRFLRNRDTKRGKGMKQGSIAMVHNVLNKFISIAAKRGMIEFHKHPYNQFKIEKGDRKARYLTREQLAKIEAVEPFNKKIQLIKDMFLFSCYTGLSLIEIENLKKSDVKEGVLITKRQKTKQEVFIPMNLLFDGKGFDIYQKYAKNINDIDVVFDGPSRTTIGVHLKQLMSLAGLSQGFTFHSGRHAFATILAGLEVKKSVIQVMLGHSTLKQTEHYSRTIPSFMIDEIKKTKWE